MGKKEVDEIIGLFLGIVGGILLAEILSRLLGYKCPKCGADIVERQIYCNNCGYRVKK